MALTLSNPVQQFFSRPVVRFSIHVFLLTGLILIGQRYWVNYQDKIEINRILEQNKALATSNSILKLQKDYFESSFYSEKSAKESQWKNLGETVIDTNNLESKNKTSDSAQKYIPETAKTELSNPQKWFKYIFEGADSK
jgi:hypothetical protein